MIGVRTQVGGRRTERWAAVLGLVAIVAVLVLGGAAPASAHAMLISTDPAEGAVLGAAPAQLRFTFNESVVAVPDGVQVYDAAGQPVGSSAAVTGPDLAVSLTEAVAEGTLVVVWRVLSADGHPVGGSLTFSVGAPSSNVTPPPTADVGDAGVPWTLSLARWVGYVALFVAAGLVAFVVLFLPATHLANRARGRAVSTARGAAAVAALAWLIGLPLTAMYQLGGGLGLVSKGSTWSTLSTVEYAVAAAIVLGSAVAVTLVRPLASDRPRAVLALVAAVVATGAPALTGHTRGTSPEFLVVGVDVLHLVVGAVWLGGLVGLALVLVDLSGRGEMAGEVLARFSGVAAGLLAVLVVTGVVLAWRIQGSWSALFDTGYGRLLLLKVLIALVAVAIAAWNRFRLLPRLRQAGRRRERLADAGLVARATAAEAAVLVAVLLVTGFLVDRSPDPEVEVAGPVAEGKIDTGPHSAPLGEYEVVAAISPHVVGPNTVTVQLRDLTGAPVDDLVEPRVSLSAVEGDVDLGALSLESVAAGTYSADVVLPTAGTWEVEVSQRIGEFENPVATLEFIVLEADGTSP